VVATARHPDEETRDQRIVLYDIPWSHYEVQAALRGEKSIPRIAYLEGVMELLVPSKNHERIGHDLGALVSAFAEEAGIELTGYKSWTLKNAPDHAGAEADECFIIGSDQRKDRPDLAIEVIVNHGGIDKLRIYARLDVPDEVWFWRDGRLEIYVLRGQAYDRVERSGCLPGLDHELMCSFLDRPTTTAAVRAYRAALRAAGSLARP
jgi:Uma2 family endonuclease